MTKILPALPGPTSLTNRCLLLERVGDLKSGQCISILDWLSEHAEVSFGVIGEITECPSRHALCPGRGPPLPAYQFQFWTTRRRMRIRTLLILISRPDVFNTSVFAVLLLCKYAELQNRMVVHGGNLVISCEKVARHFQKLTKTVQLCP